MSVLTLLLLTASLSADRHHVVAQRDTARILRDTVRLEANGIEIAATVLRPAVATTPVAAVVIAHGSGASTRDNPWTTAYAEALAKRGIAVFYPDKRGSGKSTGDWRSSSIESLASDATAAAKWLRAQRWADSSRIGVIGFSQGGYIAAVLAARDSTIAFAASISGSTQDFRTQIIDEVLLADGASLDARGTAAVRDAYAAAWGYANRQLRWSQYADRASAARRTNAATANALRTLPTDSTLWVWRWIREVGAFDPIPHWRQARVPALLVYGGRDANVRVQASVARLWDNVGAASGRFSVIVLGGNAHTLFRDDATEFLASWIRARGAN